MIKVKLFLGFFSFLSLSCLAQVSGIGINTDTPVATLDVNGNVKIRDISVISTSSNNISPLVIDNTTKEVKIVQSSTGNTFTINYITYNINNVDRDWVNNFDTKINTTDYAVVVVGSLFNSALISEGEGVFSPFILYAFEEGETWHIKADYHDGITKLGNGNWTIYCLIINKSILKVLPPIVINMNGSEIGAAASMPAGL